MRSKLFQFIQLGAIAMAVMQSGCGGQGAPVDPGDRTVVDVVEYES